LHCAPKLFLKGGGPTPSRAAACVLKRKEVRKKTGISEAGTLREAKYVVTLRVRKEQKKKKTDRKERGA